jgi:hypothetical protein
MVDLGREVNLIGGMMSGNGADGSFRGKCYSWFTEATADLSLYEAWIWPSPLEAAARAMRGWHDEAVKTGLKAALEELPGYESDIFSTDDDVDAFITMFEKYSEAGFCLHGWW